MRVTPYRSGRMLIDLHTHSTASDGTDPPAALVAVARAAGLDVVALTDHDTTVGWAEAAAVLPAGLTLVPGLELSCRWVPPDGARPTTLHVLGRSEEHTSELQSRPQLVCRL